MIRPWAKTALLTVLLGSRFAGEAEAATIRVPEDQATLFEAVAASAPGDTVLLAPGVHRGAQIVDGSVYTLASIVHPLVVRSTDGPEVTTLELDLPPLETQNRYVQVRGPQGAVTIEGLTFQGVSADNLRGLHVEYSHDVHIRSCVFRGFWGGLGSIAYLRRAGTEIGAVTVESCRFEDSGASSDATIYYRNDWPVLYGMSFEDCDFLRCVRVARFDGPAAFRRCRFERVEVVGIDRSGLSPAGPLVVEDCVFRNNIFYERGGAIRSQLADVRRCLFFDNFAHGDYSTAGVQLYSNSTLADCVFRGNASTASGYPACADVSGFMQRNVFVSTWGASAASASELPENHCNIFWDNADGDFPGDALGYVIDPQFCDPDSRDLSVMSTSPCLSPDFASCGPFALFEEGCPSRGTVVSTDPENLRVSLDGEEVDTPAYREWAEGTTHSVSVADQPYLPGRRHTFLAWSDGGDREHDIVAGPPGSELTAELQQESLLTMNVTGDGSVTPATSWYRDGTVVPIHARPNEPSLFLGWTATGEGSYDGAEPDASVHLVGPISQRAVFTRYWSATLTVEPPMLRFSVDGREFEDKHTFQWLPGSRHDFVPLVLDQPLSRRYTFDRWTDGVDDAIRTITMPNHTLELTASFDVDYYFTSNVIGEGTVLPGDGWIADSTSITLQAFPEPGWHFEEWVGGGAGSYSGPERNPTITVRDAITETAVFAPNSEIHATLVLSLSASDPTVAVSPSPLGVAPVHLWLLCQEGAGVAYLEARVEGSMPVLAFNPIPGAVNGGSSTDLLLVTPTCPVGPTRLGEFLVFDQVGGDLCLGPSAAGRLEATDCDPIQPVTFSWPTTLSVRGVTTDGTVPCESGMGCIPRRQPTAVHLLADDLRALRPNPVRGGTSVEFELEESGVVHLSVYDVAGRLIRRLASGPRPAGPQSVTWDARGEGGGRVPAGVYFVRLEAGRFAATRKAIVLE